MVLFLVRYGEIALKSPRIRRRFQQRLVQNIEDQFVRRGAECVMRSEWGRVFVEASDAEVAGWVLSHTFGVVSYSQCTETGSSMRELEQTGMQMFERLYKGASLRKGVGEGVTFAVRARRSGDHPYTSQDVGVEVGAAVMKRYAVEGVAVNLTKPDVTIYIEVRRNRGYVFSESAPGPGGMPLGTQGRVLALIDNEEAVIAAWLMMKRGCRVRLLCLPGTEEAILPLHNWDPALKVHDLGGDERSDEALVDDIEEYGNRTRSMGYAFGTTTSSYDARVRGDFRLPVFYPLIGMDKEWIARLGKRVKG